MKWRTIQVKHRKPMTGLPKIVRHNGHSFKILELEYFPYATFKCIKCELTARSERNGLVWRGWAGEGTRISCQLMIIGDVMSR